MMRCVLLVGSMVALGAVAAAQAQQAIDPVGIIEIERFANGKCRGGLGDAYQTEIACQIRDDIGRRLLELGWCFGEIGQYGAQMAWHRCNRRSNQMQGRF